MTLRPASSKERRQLDKFFFLQILFLILDLNSKILLDPGLLRAIGTLKWSRNLKLVFVVNLWNVISRIIEFVLKNLPINMRQKFSFNPNCGPIQKRFPTLHAFNMWVYNGIVVIFFKKGFFTSIQIKIKNDKIYVSK